MSQSTSIAAQFESTNGKKTLAIGGPELMRTCLCELSAVEREKKVRSSLEYHWESENAMQHLTIILVLEPSWFNIAITISYLVSPRVLSCQLWPSDHSMCVAQLGYHN